MPELDEAERNWSIVVASHLWGRPGTVVRHSPPRRRPWRATPCGIGTAPDAVPRTVAMSNAIAELFTRPCRRCYPKAAQP